MPQNKNDKVYYVPTDSPVYPNRFDTRIRLRSLTRGLLSPNEVEKYLSDLPDDASNAEVRNYTEIVDDDDASASGNGFA